VELITLVLLPTSFLALNSKLNRILGEQLRLLLLAVRQ
jgi:hypothetical protein